MALGCATQRPASPLGIQRGGVDVCGGARLTLRRQFLWRRRPSERSNPPGNTGSGIAYGATAAPGSFATWNRVRWKRCADTSSNGSQDIVLRDEMGVRRGTSTVHHKGFDNWRALLHALTNEGFRDLNGDGEADLPSLANARTIVIAGSSDASIWVTHAADRLAAELRSIAGAEVDVRIVLDGYFEPSLDNHGRYVDPPPADFDLFTDGYAETGACALPTPADPACDSSCSNAVYLGGAMADGRPSIRDQLDGRSNLLDESCVAAHPDALWQCYDKLHVLFHHVEVPWLVVADQEDNTIFGVPPIGAADLCASWSDPADYRRRVLDQAANVRDSWATAAREEGAGAAGDAAMLLRKSHRDGTGGGGNHVHLGSDEKLLWEMTLCDPGAGPVASITIGETMQRWISGTLPELFIAEDASAWDGVSRTWVTGGTCRAPE
jgi:hypothetical protein